MTDVLMKKRLESVRSSTVAKFGDRSAALGNEHYDLNVVPTPSLMLDYKLGKGGFPYGHMVEVFGANGLGKTSALGYGVLANVQRQNRLPGIIAMEPTFDAEWANRLHGLDPELLLIGRPDNAEEAFEMLHDWVYGGLVDYIMIDSIGAMASESETKEESGKKKAYGVSGVVTSGLNAVIPRMYKNNQGLLVINQQRQAGQSRQGNTFHESPGGEALKHHAQIRIQLKPKEKFTATIDSEKVVVGRELSCVFRKNKLAQAAEKSANFIFYNIETEDYGLGVDKVSDLINVGKMTGVIEAAGGWFKHEAFPKGSLQGRNAVAAFIKEESKVVEMIREQVMAKMITREIKLAKEKNDTD